ncbi:MAG: hypothetical protein RL119_501, partial [Actinomycetota bacterium]
ENDLAIGDGVQKPLHECRANKAGGSGDGDASSLQIVDDHPFLLAQVSTKW